MKIAGYKDFVGFCGFEILWHFFQFLHFRVDSIYIYNFGQENRHIA